MQKEDCKICFLKRKDDDKYYCDAYKVYPEFKFNEICCYYQEYKPYKYKTIYALSGMKCKDCEHFQSYRSAYEDELEDEDCGFCQESEIKCHVSADEDACSLFKKWIKK